MTDKREMTALDAPVGAGAEQSLNNTIDIIPDYGENFNPSSEEMFEAQMQYEQEMQAQAQAGVNPHRALCRLFRCRSFMRWSIQANRRS